MSSDLILKQRATIVTFTLYNSTHVLSLTGEKTHLKKLSSFEYVYVPMYEDSVLYLYCLYAPQRPQKTGRVFFISRCNLSQCLNHS